MTYDIEYDDRARFANRAARAVWKVVEDGFATAQAYWANGAIDALVRGRRYTWLLHADEWGYVEAEPEEHREAEREWRRRVREWRKWYPDRVDFVPETGLPHGAGPGGGKRRHGRT